MDRPTVLRVNCGSGEDLACPDGVRWTADREWAEGSSWGAEGGGAAVREKTLPILETACPGIYRTERHGLSAYRFAVSQGTYTLRLHFAETFGCNYTEGRRSFSVHVGEGEICSEFDPYREAGGFARPVVLEVAGCCPNDDGQIVVGFKQGGMINAIELERTASEAPRASALRAGKLTRVCAPCERYVGASMPFDPDGTAWRVLFIGNSGTFYWAIPESLQAMLATGQSAVRITPEKALRGGQTLAFHFEETDVTERIAAGGYDLVVLQEGSANLTDSLTETRDYVGRFDRVIREAGARTVLYAYPGRAAFTDAHRRKITAVHAELAERYRTVLVPACEALRLAKAERPDVVYHDADGTHLGMFGGYLAACTFYAVFSGLPAAGHPAPAILAQQVPIAPEMARFCQRIADRAVTTSPSARI